MVFGLSYLLCECASFIFLSLVGCFLAVLRVKNKKSSNCHFLINSCSIETGKNAAWS